MLGKFSRILVVDDSATVRTVVTSMLKKMGYENIHQAADRKSALAVLTVRRYALVVSDWNMTPMNGLDLFRELRARSHSVPVPFIIMTTYSVKFAAVARCEGAIHYLAKPFTVDQLAAKILQATSGLAA